MKSVDGVGANPVGEVAERAAREQPDREPQSAARRVEGEAAEDQRQRGDGDHEHEPPALAEQPEGDAPVCARR